jgi:hypothetical protein
VSRPKVRQYGKSDTQNHALFCLFDWEDSSHLFYNVEWSIQRTKDHIVPSRDGTFTSCYKVLSRPLEETWRSFDRRTCWNVDVWLYVAALYDLDTMAPEYV